MVQKIGSLSAPGVLGFDRSVARFEHHKIYVKVTSFVSEVNVRVEDKTVAINTDDSADVVNLNATSNEIIDGNGIFSYLIENARMDGLQLNFVSGDADLEVFYTGW